MSTLSSLDMIDYVIPSYNKTAIENLNLIKPDYVVHGDDWKTGNQKKTRERVVKTLRKWSGKLIEPKYTKNISSNIIKNKIFQILGN